MYIICSTVSQALTSAERFLVKYQGVHCNSINCFSVLLTASQGQALSLGKFDLLSTDLC